MSGRTLIEANRPTSPAYRLLALLWDEASIGRSRQRWDAAIQEAVHLAITAEMEWGEGDLVWLSGATARWNRYTDEGRDCGVGYSATESDYALACRFRGGPNLSFCQAFERKVGRPPFILKTPDNNSGSRLHVGASFMWERERVSVTSFADDGGSLIACSYHPREPGVYQRRTPKSRYTITLEGVREAGREAVA